MDRWLWASLTGYALTFFMSQPILLLQWSLVLGITGIIASNLAPLYLNRALIVGVLCGILWGSGNSYFHQLARLPAERYGVTLPIEVAVQSITQVEQHYWRIEGKLVAVDGKPQRPAPRVRLNWYQPPPEISPPAAGTRWLFETRLRAPQGVRNDGGFLYHRYLIGQGIQALGTIRSGQWLAGQPNYRQRLFDRMVQLLQESPYGGILQALTLGERQHISREQWVIYQRTGLAHLIAISGLHLSLVAAGVIWLGQRLVRYQASHRKRREIMNSWYWATLIALVATFYYASLAGFATATIRAFAMFSVLLVHKYYGVYTPPSRVLLRAVSVVVLVQPMAPLQTGFWLSVGAVATILMMHWRWPVIRGKWAWLRSLWRLEWVLTLALWPFTALWFGGVPVLAPLVNLVVIPLVSFWVLPLALLGTLALIVTAEPLAAALLHWAELPLTLLNPLLATLAHAPWQWLPTHVSGAGVGLSLLLLSWLWPWRWRYKVATSMGFVLLQLVSVELQQRDTSVKLHVLDVEQGSAIVIQQGQEALLIDTGANWALGGSMAERAIIPFLEQHRLTPQTAFVSHSDNDHLGGYRLLAARYPQLRWFGSGTGLPCAAGQTGQWRRVSWQVLHPRKVTENRHNDESCVVRLQIGKASVLVPGDITYRAERQLLAYVAPVASDILVLAHHGSNSSSEEIFLRAVQPQLALASRGRNNAYGMVAEPVKERLRQLQIPLLDTALGGQITVRFEAQGWTVEQPWAGQGRPWFDADN